MNPLDNWKKVFEIVEPAIEYRPISTLQSIVANVSPALAFISDCDDKNPAENELAIEITKLAISYCNYLFWEIGLDEINQALVPINKKQCQSLLANIIKICDDRQYFMVIENAKSNMSKQPTEKTGFVFPDIEDNLKIIKEKYSVSINGKDIHLGNTKEFRLLYCLNEKFGEFISHDTLINNVWDGDDTTNQSSIHKVVSITRKILSDNQSGFYIATTKGYYTLKRNDSSQ